MHKSTRRRFIAGAVCPRCGELDKIAVDADMARCYCVSCGFSEDRPTGEVDHPGTRVSRAAARRVQTPAEPVTLVDPRKEG